MTDRRGFTLLEVIVVMAIAVALAAMVYPSINVMYADARVMAGADLVRARWADARTHAIEDGRAYRFSVASNDGRFRIAPDAAEFWNGGDGGGADGEDGAPAFVLEDTLPDGITFDTAGLAGGGEEGGWTTVVRFLPTGSASDDRVMTLSSKDARPIELHLRALTASVSVVQGQTGKTP